MPPEATKALIPAGLAEAARPAVLEFPKDEPGPGATKAIGPPKLMPAEGAFVGNHSVGNFMPDWPVPERPSRRGYANSSETGGQSTVLRGELMAAWGKGNPEPAEAVLRDHPECQGNSQLIVGLIYEEICLRQQAGEPHASAVVVRRFPQWREQLEVLLDCHHLLQPVEPRFPGVGETLGEFHLLRLLGKGAQGSVFLAKQPSLADRMVVLKVTPCEGEEHLSLARLQHAYIVPLYLVQQFADRQLQGLCMPYLGGMTLSSVLDSVEKVPPAQRTGRHIQDALDCDQARESVQLPARDPVRAFLNRASFAQAICWLGACLADALQYAHERDLIHLDIKSSNILIAADGQPMLLDFHLAQAPLLPNGPTPRWLGGTPGFMAPEQDAAFNSLASGNPIPERVDGRADVYSLGVVLWQALGGPFPLPKDGNLLNELLKNPQVSPGLADIVLKCLAVEPKNRYADAASLAADLRCHLADRPLLQVRNRSWRERWQKWRRRRPGSLVVAVAVLLLLTAGLGAGADGWHRFATRDNDVRAELDEGKHQLEQGLPKRALTTFSRALANARPASPLAEDLSRGRNQAIRTLAAADLHGFVDQLRFLILVEGLPAPERARMEIQCLKTWQNRVVLLDQAKAPLTSAQEEQVRTDLLDMVILWSDLWTGAAPQELTFQTENRALQVLRDGEQALGKSPTLEREQRNHTRIRDGQPPDDLHGTETPPATEGEFASLGRALMQSGNTELAAVQFNKALDRYPQNFWLNFYQGICSLRLGRPADASRYFHVCVVLAPTSADCYYHRALAFSKLGKNEAALGDYGKALTLDPRMARASLNRGLLFYQDKQFQEAGADFTTALANGADPATAHYNLALVHLALQNRFTAQRSLNEALRINPEHTSARELQTLLKENP